MIPAKRLPRSAVLFSSLLLVVSFAVARPVTLDDMNKVKWPGSPQLSADGKQVAYEADGRIYVVATSGGEPRAVTTAGSSASDPLWSRDGKWLYFLSDRADKKSQLWKLPLTSFGEATQITT